MDAILLPLRVLRLGGMWAPEPTRGRRWCLYAAYTALSLLIQLISLAAIGAQVLLGELGAELIAVLNVFLPCFNAYLKAVGLQFQRARLWRLLRQLQDLPRPAPQSEGAAALARAARAGYLLTVAYFAISFVALLFWMVSPFANRNETVAMLCRRQQQSALEAAANTTAAAAAAAGCRLRELPTDARFPFDHSSGWGYALAYATQVAGVIFAFIAQNFSMSLLACLMLHVAAQWHVLAERLRAARDSRALHVCVRHHQAVLRCVSEVQALVGPAALAQFTYSLVILCISLYNATKESGVVVKGLYLAMVPALLLDVFLLCEMGEQVTMNGQRLSLAIYESPWLDAPLRMRRELITVLMRSQRDLRLFTAGGFADLSRETFLSVLRSSYSLYTLLLTVDE